MCIKEKELVINPDQFSISTSAKDLVPLHWGVETTDAMIAPELFKSESSVKRIFLVSIYCKPKSRKKTALLDYLSDVYHVMNKQNSEGTYWIIAGDANYL